MHPALKKQQNKMKECWRQVKGDGETGKAAQKAVQTCMRDGKPPKVKKSKKMKLGHFRGTKGVLGSPPEVHEEKAQYDANEAEHKADKARKLADKGDCARAVVELTDATFDLGAAKAHLGAHSPGEETKARIRNAVMSVDSATRATVSACSKK